MSLSFLFTSAIFAKDDLNIQDAKSRAKEREEKLRKVVERELAIAERTMRYSSNKGEISLRLLASYSDMMRMVKMEENKKFLNSDEQNANKDHFFKRSMALEAESRNFVMEYINQKGDFEGIDRIYFTLGLNSRDYGDGKYTLLYLKKSLEATKDRDIRITVETVLGDYYYNDKKFDLAIKYYESILKDDKVEWWTKYAYNLAWCYLKIKKHNAAIILLKDVISRSRKKEYIDYSRTALEKVGTFYAYAHKEYEGVDYIIKVADKPAPYLKNMASFLISREDNAKAEYVLKTAYKYADIKDKVEINLSLMQIYEKQRMMDRVFTVSNKFFEEKLNLSLNEVQVGEMEIYLKNLIVFHDESINKGKRTKEAYVVITSTYEKLMLLKIPFTSVHLYRLSLLNIEYKNHTKSYGYAEEALKAYEGSEKYLEKETLYKLIIAELNEVCRSKQKELAKCQEEKVAYYNLYLKDFKSGELAKDTYIGLFNIALEKKDLARAEHIVDNFIKAFPLEKDSQRNLVKNILDYHQKDKNLDELRRWEDKIEGLSLFAGAPDAQILKNVVSGLAFEKTVGILKLGGITDEAYKGFLGIYNDTKNKPELRMRSALNIGIGYYENKKHSESIKWIDQAVALMTPKELKDTSKQLLSVADGFFSRGDLAATKTYSTNLFKSLCGSVDVNLDNLYEKNLLSLYYSGYEGEALKLLNFNYPCPISGKIKNKLLNNLISMTSEFGGLDSLIKLKPYIGVNTIKFYEKALFEHFSHLNEWEKNNAWEKLGNIVDLSKDPFASFKTIDIWLSEASKYVESRIKPSDYQDEGKFNEGKFDKVITSQISGIEKLAKKGKKIIKSGVLENQYSVLFGLGNCYASLAEAISDVDAVGMPQDYRSEFKKQMAGFSKQMLGESEKYKSQAAELEKRGANTSSKDLSLSKVFSVFHKERLLRYDLPQ